MKKIGILLVLVVFACGMALAQDPSAKFAAVWSTELAMADTYANTCVDGEVGDAPDWDLDIDTGGAVLFATMKMPSGKEILAGVSGESTIVLLTGVKGKNGGSAVALGWGRVAVKIYAKNVDTGEVFYPVPDKEIVLNARVQGLGATLGGVIESCTVGDDGVIDVATECEVTPEEIALLTASRSANHFNVVFTDLPSGTYKVKAKFKLLSLSLAGSTEDACAYAGSWVALGNRIVTLQDVRAVKGSLEPVDITW